MTEISSGVGDLIARLREDGVDRGNAEAKQIVEGAEEQARLIIAKANDQAAEIKKAASDETEQITRQLNGELKLAARDFLTEFQRRLTQEVTRPLVSKNISAPLSNVDILGPLLSQVLSAWLVDGEEIEASVSSDLKTQLEGHLAGELSAQMKDERIQLKEEPGLVGFRLKRTKEDFTWDISLDALTEALLPLFDKRLRALLTREPSVSIVYLITSLPHLPDLEETEARALPISLADFIRRAEAALVAPDEQAVLETLFLINDVDEACRAMANLQEAEPDAELAALATAIRQRRARLQRPISTAERYPWLLQPLPRHVLMRSCYRAYVASTNSFLSQWGSFATDLSEVLTGLLARMEGMSPDEFLEQMRGHFDSASEIIVRRFEEPDLGLKRRFRWLPRVVEALHLPDRPRVELLLDRLRWEHIESFGGLDTFSLDFICAYFHKLRILERRSSWDSEIGTGRLNKLLSLPAQLHGGESNA